MRKNINRFACVILATAPMLVGARAYADVAPPETEPCQAKSAGTACTYSGHAGTCQDQTCTKLDYYGWNRDASAAPPTTSYDCRMCVTATTSNTAVNTATGTTTDTSTSTDDGGWCAIGKPQTMKRLGPWLLGAAFSLLFVFGKRRKQS
jgi:hypothetical protein